MNEAGCCIFALRNYFWNKDFFWYLIFFILYTVTHHIQRWSTPQWDTAILFYYPTNHLQSNSPICVKERHHLNVYWQEGNNFSVNNSGLTKLRRAEQCLMLTFSFYTDFHSLLCHMQKLDFKSLQRIPGLHPDPEQKPPYHVWYQRYFSIHYLVNLYLEAHTNILDRIVQDTRYSD